MNTKLPNTLLFLSVLFLMFSCVTKKSTKINTIVDQSIITQKHTDLQGFQLILKNVYNDSRCPEGVTCVWAGEVTVEIEVFENNKLIEEKTLVFNSRNTNENKVWFAKYYPEKPIQSVLVLPYPKDGITNELKDYFLKIE